MKTKLLSILALMLISSSLFSQGITFGLKAGANMGKIDGQSFDNAYNLGYHVGAFVTLGSGKWSIQPEVLFNQVNTDTASDFNQITQLHDVGQIQLRYLSIPIMLNYNLSNILAIQAGPQFGILMDKSKNLVQNGQDAFKSRDFSLAAGLQLKLSKLRVYGRLVGGLTDLNNLNNNDTWKVQMIQVGVGFAL